MYPTIKLWNKFILDSIPCEGRDFLVEEAAHISEGLTGRDIRTCMRLALPKVLIESKNKNTSPYLSLLHIESAIAQLKTAHNEIGTEVNQKTEETNAALKMLGVNTRKYENASTARGFK